MADLSVTATSVVAVESEVGKQEYIAGATITAGQAVYIDTANSNVVKPAQADGTLLEATVAGVALNGGATGQPIIVAVSGKFNPGATVAVGTVYILSATAGGICPAADLVSSSYCSVIGVGTTASELTLGINNSGVEKP